MRFAHPASPCARRAAFIAASAALCALLAACGAGGAGPSARACERLADADLPSLLGGQIRPPVQAVDDAAERGIYLSTCSVRRVHGSRRLALLFREHLRPEQPLASEQVRRMKESLSRDLAQEPSWREIDTLGEAAAWSPELRQLIVVDDEGRRSFLFSLSDGGDPEAIAVAAARAALQ